jgi:membrane associated rhomboid family serine protease
VVYVGSILSSGFVSLHFNRDNPAYASVGASDAVSGVVLSYCCFYPFSNLYILFFPFPIPAILYGVLFIAISAQLMERSDRVIAHEGHLGGALGGAALTMLMRPEVVTRIFN